MKELSVKNKVWAIFLGVCLLAPSTFLFTVQEQTCPALYWVRACIGGFGLFMWLCVLLIAAAADGNP
jgi:hypothetical protein